MSYRREFSANWRYVLASTLGMGLGSAFNHYIGSLFAPALIAEFGWSRSQYALIGSAAFITMFVFPLMGRLVDHFGARAGAMIGYTALPIGYLALSFMNGDFALFFAITVAKGLFGILTATIVFARIVVERFEKGRGLALSILMTGPALFGVVGAPLMGWVIDEHGWRVAYRVMAVMAALGGWTAILLMGSEKSRAASATHAGPKVPFDRQVLFSLLRMPVFYFTIFGMLLVNIPQVVAPSQLKLVLEGTGAPGAIATGLVGLYAGGVAVGRLACGFALDRLAVHKVALVALTMPAIGLAALASPFDAPWVLIGAVLMLALAQGAEGDIGAYLVSRRFPLEHYSFLMSFLTIALTLGAAFGSLILSYTLHRTDEYNTFLLISVAATLIGALLFYLTGSGGPAERKTEKPEATPAEAPIA